MPSDDLDLNNQKEPAGGDWLPDNDSIDQESGKRQRLFRRILALICLFAFSGLILANLNSLLGDLPPYLKQFPSLSSQELVKNSQPAVVNILAFNSTGSMAASPRQGTGFNIDPRGLIITNRHVIENCHEIRVDFSDGSSYTSNQLKTIGNWDVALVRLNAQKLPVLTTDFSRLPAAGELLTIVGNPEGYQGIPAQGALSGYVNEEGSSSVLMLINASIGPGNSGSPVLDERGKVVGVVFAMTGEGQNSMALAIPIAVLSNMLNWASF